MRTLVFALLLAILTARGDAVRAQAPAAAPDFTLLNQSGAPVSLHQFRGRLVLLSFIYTHCPDVCPLTTAKLVRVQNDLKARRWFGSRVVLLTMTFDPERDTPAVMNAYAAKFKVDHSGWHFLSGPSATVRTVIQAYRIPVRPGARKGLIDHGLPTLVIDPQGRILGYYDPDFNPADVVRDLARLLGS
jgi:protein SCO1/2